MGFFSMGKIRKNKMFVLRCRSLLDAIHIAEKKLYDSIQMFIFSNGNFYPFGNMGNIPWDFSIF